MFGPTRAELRVHVKLRDERIADLETQVDYWREKAERAIDRLAQGAGGPIMREPERSTLDKAVQGLMTGVGVQQINRQADPPHKESDTH